MRGYITSWKYLIFVRVEVIAELHFHAQYLLSVKLLKVGNQQKIQNMLVYCD